MALIRSIKRVSRDRYSVHGEVECVACAFVSNGHTYLQLDTGGSRTRKLKGKTSQSIQLDQVSAVDLITLIRATFKLP